MSEFAVETPKNYEQKCLCVLVLDVSGSMKGAPIAALNQALQDFKREVEEDDVAASRLEVAVVTFSNIIEVVQEPSLIEYVEKMPALEAGGLTYLVDGMNKALEIVAERKKFYQETGQKYYRPWIVLFTDGAPDPGQDIEGLAKDIKDGMDGKKFMFYSIGVEGADMEVLSRIAPPQIPPLMLQGLKFSEFFKWLSNSLTMVTHSKEGQTIALPSTNSWAQMTI